MLSTNSKGNPSTKSTKKPLRDKKGQFISSKILHPRNEKGQFTSKKTPSKPPSKPSSKPSRNGQPSRPRTRPRTPDKKIPLEDRLFTDRQSRYNYVIKAKNNLGETRTLTVSSKRMIKMPRKSEERKALYRKAKSKYSKYNFDIRRMKLVSTFDLITGEKVSYA